MNIVVLAGGLSTERDVSFATGDMVAKALRRKGHKVILTDVFMGMGDGPMDLTDIFEKSREVSIAVSGIPTVAPDLEAVKKSRKDQSDCFFGPNIIELCRMADIVFIALHGANGEDGRIQAAFDLFGIKYTGTDYLSSAMAMDKELTKELFRANHIPTPCGVSMEKSARAALKDTGLTLPIVVKPCRGGSSVGVSIVRSQQEYEAALDTAFQYENQVILEDYIEGREFSVGVLEGKALPVIEIAPVEGFYDYKNKYKAGSAVETCPADLPAEISGEMQRYAEEAVKVLGLRTYSRMDFLMNGGNEIFCLEANTLPGMTPTSLLPQEAGAVGMSFEDLCQKIVEISLDKWK